MKLKGLKVNFLGDSITEGIGTTGEQATFSSILKRECEFLESRNYGIGGTRFARQAHPSEEPRWDLDFCGRVEEMDADADLIVIFGGTNDYGHGDAPIGSMQDRTPWTFYGACHVLFRSIIEKYPESKIVVMTPLHRINEDKGGEDYKLVLGPPLSTYVEIIKCVARYYSIPVLDLFSVSGLQPNVPCIMEKYLPDGLHPNDAGHIILAEKIKAFLNSL